MSGSIFNIFRVSADFSHLTSIIILIVSMILKNSCAGISLKTRIIYLIVFISRYVGPYLFYPPFYNIIFRFLYLGTSILIIVLMLTKLKRTYDKRHDSFRIEILLIGALIVALITTDEYSIDSILHAFSLWLESVAILPQLFMLYRTQRIDNMNYAYIFFLGMYRLLYIFNWLYRYFIRHKKVSFNSLSSGILQTIIYADFLYYYIKAILSGTEFSLPI